MKMTVKIKPLTIPSTVQFDGPANGTASITALTQDELTALVVDFKDRLFTAWRAGQPAAAPACPPMPVPYDPLPGVLADGYALAPGVGVLDLVRAKLNTGTGVAALVVQGLLVARAMTPAA